MTTNLEEAATTAAEFISSLDNLPSEVQHLLAEIRHKETRSQELQQGIQKESAKYIRHSLRAASSTPAQPLSTKDSVIPQTIQADYAEIDRLAIEKKALAERIVQIIMRAQAKLDHDLAKVLRLQGDPDGVHLSHHPGSARSSVALVTESLRNAIAIPDAAPSTPAAAPPAPPLKRRKMTSIKLPSPAPVAPSTYSVASHRSRLSQQVHPRPSPARGGRRGTASVGPDEDAEGEDDVEDTAEDNGDDQQLYCYCQKLSYGEMIACDNPDCGYQWFHLPCVNLKPPLPDSWFCEECSAKRGLGGGVSGGAERRKGRKK